MGSPIRHTAPCRLHFASEIKKEQTYMLVASLPLHCVCTMLVLPLELCLCGRRVVAGTPAGGRFSVSPLFWPSVEDSSTSFSRPGIGLKFCYLSIMHFSFCAWSWGSSCHLPGPRDASWRGAGHLPCAFFPLGSVFSSALCYCTAELLSSCGHPSSVRLSVVHPFIHPSARKTHFLRTRQAY